MDSHPISADINESLEEWESICQFPDEVSHQPIYYMELQNEPMSSEPKDVKVILEKAIN